MPLSIVSPLLDTTKEAENIWKNIFQNESSMNMVYLKLTGRTDFIRKPTVSAPSQKAGFRVPKTV